MLRPVTAKTEDVYGAIYGRQIFLLKSKSLHDA